MNKEIVMSRVDIPMAGLQQTPPPWWRFRIVWFAIGLPALVVLASLYTASLAWRHADPVVVDPRPGHSASAQDAAESGHPSSAMEPAERARNHAATPGR